TVVDLAAGDLFLSGHVTGSYADTHAADGKVQSITETHDGGPKKHRRQGYAHAWTFDVFGGAGGSIVSAEAWVSGSEG
ncbi:MAG: hypothetical protein RQ826_18120, partial [Xanthomonadales bacterium]|nr:hypothetical protein [Xanthomonadales bacterium]